MLSLLMQRVSPAGMPQVVTAKCPEWSQLETPISPGGSPRENNKSYPRQSTQLTPRRHPM